MATTIRDRLMPVDMRTWNPRGCLVSVINDPVEARQATLALRQAGFGDEDVRLAPAWEITQIGDAQASGGWFTRFVRGIGSLGDESIVAAAYLDEARRGHQLLIVYALHDDLKRHAYTLLARYRAHTFQYFGRWIITDQV